MISGSENFWIFQYACGSGAFVFVERHDFFLFLAYCDAGRCVKMRFHASSVRIVKVAEFDGRTLAMASTLRRAY